MDETNPDVHIVTEAEKARAELFERCKALLPLFPPGTAFSHLTAAQLHGLPMSRSMENDTRIHTIRPLPSTQIRQPGVVGHRARHKREIVNLDGLPVVGLADTWADLGELIGRGLPVGLDDVIVVGDAIATILESAMPLWAAVAKRVRPRGKRTLVEALGLIRVGSRSPRETILRIMLVRVGIPEPMLNEPAFTDSTPRRLLGVGDLVWILRDPLTGTVLKVVVEYQGAEFHSGPSRRGRDKARRRGFRDDGWLVEWVWASNLLTTAARRATCLRIASALGVPRESLELSACESRFFSEHRMEQAIQRDTRRRMRSA